MRKGIITVGCLLVAGCGAFSGESDPPAATPPGDAPTNNGQTPSDNATNVPPVGGTAVAGVYVSASLGLDGATGSAAHPLKKLADAIALAKAQNLPVNACAETYAEAVTLVDGVSMFGYLDCTKEWVRGAANAKIVSPTSPAMTAASITLPTRIAGFDVQAPDLDALAAADAPASIALSVRDSKNLTFSAFVARAGKGAPGANGAAAATNAATFSAPGNARDQYAPCAGLLKPTFCTNAGVGPNTSSAPGGTATCALGGAGGAGGVSGAPRIFLDGGMILNPSIPPQDGQAGGGAAPGAGGTNGGNGANGGDGTPGLNGANGQWLLTADGFAVGNGTAGAGGSPGAGGGGGGATTVFWDAAGNVSAQPGSGYYITASGAGGGAGGCAGQAGTPGTGGGASIAAFVVRSAVTFEQSRLESAAGGRAGKGTLGTIGTPGQAGLVGLTRKKLSGTPPALMTIHITGDGGTGGSGGSGGASGHGAPGPSIALAYSGDRPTLTGTDLAPGPAGEGQPELTNPSTVPAIAGISEAEHHIQ
ncbi:MAG: virulence associated protein [Labilithrix sp.]|nr:virulence associated protein [Labilithrix sp.]